MPPGSKCGALPPGRARVVGLLPPLAELQPQPAFSPCPPPPPQLHGSWRQPGKTLRLLSDAKARGMELGGPVYAALVQALCK